MGLIGIVIASLVNLFVGSSMLQFMISIIGVIIFTGLTAYDTQNIKEGYVQGLDAEVTGKKAIFGALQLYLDFINLFLTTRHVFLKRDNISAIIPEITPPRHPCAGRDPSIRT